MRPRFARVLAPVLVLLGVLCCASPSSADLAEIQKRGTLRVLVVDGTPAFFGVKAGTAPGLDREMLDGFAKLQRVQLEVVEISTWDALFPALVAGKGDVVAGGVTVTPARQKLATFTSEVFPTRDVVLTRKPHRVVTTVEQLREEKVGTIKGTSFAQTVAEALVPAKNVDDSVPSDGLAEALRSGQATAVVDGIEDALLLQKADPALQIGTFLGKPSSLAFAVRKADTALLKALDVYVANMRKSPTWSRLVVKYFGTSAVEVLKKARAE